MVLMEISKIKTGMEAFKKLPDIAIRGKGKPKLKYTKVQWVSLIYLQNVSSKELLVVVYISYLK